MSKKTKNLAYAAAGFLALLYVGWAFFGGGGTEPTSYASIDAYGSPIDPYAYPSPTATAVMPSPVPASQFESLARRSYALSEADVSGLPLDTPPGTRLELWVAWEPPVTRTAKLQLLIRDVVLEKVISGFPEGAPATILLSLRARDVDDMLWADRYGALSLTIAG
jgi:hypothetical protein